MATRKINIYRPILGDMEHLQLILASSVGPPSAVLLLLLGPCLINLLTKFISSHIQATCLQMILQQGYQSIILGDTKTMHLGLDANGQKFQETTERLLPRQRGRQ